MTTSRSDNKARIVAAIAAALSMELESGAHDLESGVITIKKAASSEWGLKSRNFRKLPHRR
ncbi:MAG: hypothetical protein IJU69_02965 [Bacteroidales bacterium]|nr:hypothetical protein [Bacteroidales bacterium]